MDRCNAAELLRLKNVKVTKNRIAILNEIISSNNPVNAIDLHNGLPEQLTVNLATVYRMLKLFVDVGILREAIADNGTQYFEMACVHNPAHAHFQCSQCKRIICLSPLTFEDTILFSEASKIGEINEINIKLKGICQKCRSTA